MVVQIDRLGNGISIEINQSGGLTSSAAIKGPCLVATTANISLAGEQTIDGVAVTAGKRVLVKEQSTASENGVYLSSTGDWQRAPDFNRSGEVVEGTQVYVVDGSAAAGWYAVTTSDPIDIGSDAIAFERGNGDVTAAATIADGALVVGDGGGKGVKAHASGAPGDAAFKDTGTTAGTVAAGDHTHSDLIGGTAGTTDNAIPRADGAGGKTLQASGVTIDDSDRMIGHGNMAWTAATEGSSQVSFDCLNGARLNFYVTATATFEVQAPANLPDGWTALIEVDPDGQTMSWAAGYRAPAPEFTGKALVSITRRGSEYIAGVAHEASA